MSYRKWNKIVQINHTVANQSVFKYFIRWSRASAELDGAEWLHFTLLDFSCALKIFVDADLKQCNLWRRTLKMTTTTHLH